MMTAQPSLQQVTCSLSPMTEIVQHVISCAFKAFCKASLLHLSVVILPCRSR